MPMSKTLLEKFGNMMFCSTKTSPYQGVRKIVRVNGETRQRSTSWIGKHIAWHHVEQVVYPEGSNVEWQSHAEIPKRENPRSERQQYKINVNWFVREPSLHISGSRSHKRWNANRILRKKKNSILFFFFENYSNLILRVLRPESSVQKYRESYTKKCPRDVRRVFLLGFPNIQYINAVHKMCSVVYIVSRTTVIPTSFSSRIRLNKF